MVISFLVTAFISKHFSIGTLAFAILIICCNLIIAIMSPIDNKHKRLTKDEKKKCKTVSIVLSLSITLIDIIMLILQYSYYNLILFTLVLVAIAKDLQDTEKYMVTGNRTLDYILSSKITENREITFICTGNCLDALDHIDELDIAVLFGNMLDNAIDAVKSIADKTVEIRFSRFNDFFNIHISNPIEESVLKSNPNLLTSKKGEGHGWGLKSVQSIVEKYSGLFDCYEQNNKFTVHISFSKPV